MASAEEATGGSGGEAGLVPPELLELVLRRFDPWRVILFGSRARGDGGPDSDWDLLVVLDDGAPPELLGLEAAYAAVMDFPLAADVIPVRRGRFEYKRDVVGSLAWTADREGIVIYERA